MQLAVRAENAADGLLRERARLGAGAGEMRWKSSAAASFGQRARDGGDMLLRDANRLDELAAALRRHVRHVQEHLQVLADLERRAENTVHAAEQVQGWVESHVPW